jgi:hypothetical protein
VHYFQTVTTAAEGHRHRMQSFVYAANGNASDGHIHYIRGTTERVAGHTHRYYDKTSPPIPLPDGSHYHTLSGVTYYNYTRPLQLLAGGEPIVGGVAYTGLPEARHRHSYVGATSRNFGEPPPGW